MLRILFLFCITCCVQAQNLPKMVLVKGGTFKRTFFNEEGEKVTKKIKLSSFYIATTEVTVAQYKLFCKETKNQMPPEPEWGFKENYPIVNINWYDAKKYCKWLSKKTGKNYNLPTEAQWEYAARGGKLTNNFTYSGSNDINTVSWYRYNAFENTKPVATKNPNELGLYDMSGNAAEWCLDWFSDDFYSKAKTKNPINKTQGTFGKHKVIRGGSWYDNKEHCKVAHRFDAAINERDSTYGFRVVINKKKKISNELK